MGGGDILFKVHESYRLVIAVCDVNVYGRKLVEGKMVLDLSGEFFNGDVKGDAEVLEEIVRFASEDATFNFVGDRCVRIALDLGLIKKEGVLSIEGVPFALMLL